MRRGKGYFGKYNLTERKYNLKTKIITIAQNKQKQKQINK